MNKEKRLKDINLEIFYREETIEELKKKKLDRWSDRDRELYIYHTKCIEHLRKEQKRLESNCDRTGSEKVAK